MLMRLTISLLAKESQFLICQSVTKNAISKSLPKEWMANAAGVPREKQKDCLKIKKPKEPKRLT